MYVFKISYVFFKMFSVHFMFIYVLYTFFLTFVFLKSKYTFCGNWPLQK